MKSDQFFDKPDYTYYGIAFAPLSDTFFMFITILTLSCMTFACLYCISSDDDTTPRDDQDKTNYGTFDIPNNNESKVIGDGATHDSLELC